MTECPPLGAIGMRTQVGTDRKFSSQPKIASITIRRSQYTKHNNARSKVYSGERRLARSSDPLFSAEYREKDNAPIPR
jgi:hypothetical protein